MVLCGVVWFCVVMCYMALCGVVLCSIVWFVRCGVACAVLSGVYSVVRCCAMLYGLCYQENKPYTLILTICD